MNITQLLIQKKANIEALDKENRTPLLTAAIEGNDCIPLLLDAGAKIDVKDKQSRTVIYLLFSKTHCNNAMPHLVWDLIADTKKSGVHFSKSILKKIPFMNLLLMRGASVSASGAEEDSLANLLGEEKAISVYVKEVRPEFLGILHFCLGEALYKFFKNDWRLTIKLIGHFKNAVEINHPIASRRLGEVFERERFLVDAIQYYQKALDLGDTKVLYNIAKMMQRIGSGDFENDKYDGRRTVAELLGINYDDYEEDVDVDDYFKVKGILAWQDIEYLGQNRDQISLKALKALKQYMGSDLMLMLKPLISRIEPHLNDLVDQAIRQNEYSLGAFLLVKGAEPSVGPEVFDQFISDALKNESSKKDMEIYTSKIQNYLEKEFQGLKANPASVVFSYLFQPQMKLKSESGVTPDQKSDRPEEKERLISLDESFAHSSTT